ncbi:2-hydroxyacid dehydrogenase [Poseidonocella pacifica]|nr:glyoxylate/hydroxypyruvate reductase A [Poseidonocella pacifica]
MTNVLFAAPVSVWEAYEAPLRDAFAQKGLSVNLATDLPPEMVDYIIYAPQSGLRDFRPFTRAKAVLNLWAGVETIVGNETLTQPLTRMVDEGLTQGMVEYVTGHVLRHHLGMDIDLLRDTPSWEPRVPPLASERKVTILGLGILGAACATALSNLGFAVSGWARRAKSIEGVQSYGGEAGLVDALHGAEIVVLLLPLTDDTHHLVDSRTLALLAPGAFVINPGRGPLIDDQSLLEALDTGHVAHATLDVFATEPLPADHPYWAHPRVTVTPHIASHTRPKTSANVIAENIRRGEAGEPLLHLVDRGAGY